MMSLVKPQIGASFNNARVPTSIHRRGPRSLEIFLERDIRETPAELALDFVRGLQVRASNGARAQKDRSYLPYSDCFPRGRFVPMTCF